MKKNVLLLACLLLLVFSGMAQTTVPDCSQYPTQSAVLNTKVDSINNTLLDIGVTFTRQTDHLTEAEFEELVTGFNNSDPEFLVRYSYVIDTKFESKQATVLRLKAEAKQMIVQVFHLNSDKTAAEILAGLCKCAAIAKRGTRQTGKMMGCKEDKVDCVRGADGDYAICASAAAIIGAASGPLWFIVGGTGIMLCIRDYRKDVRGCNKAYNDCIQQ
jgi:hypothetical protein